MFFQQAILQIKSNFVTPMKNEFPNFDEFPKSDFHKWKTEAQHLLKNEDPELKLRWQSIEGVSLNAYYDSSNTLSLNYLTNYFSNLPKKKWILYERVNILNEKEANKHALSSLMGGCDGVLFSGNFEDLNLDQLLANILPEHCYVAFEHTGNKPFTLEPTITGIKGFGRQVIHSKDHFLTGVAEEDPALGLILSSANLLNQTLKAASSSDTNGGMVLTLKPGPDFFHELARLRALKVLLNKAIPLQSGKNLPVHFHVEPQPGTSEGAHLLQQTTSGLASIIGGADSIAFHPGNSEWAANGAHRVSRNIGNLIRHESRLGELADFSNGSYFIDSLTDQLARSIWEEVKRSKP